MTARKTPIATLALLTALALTTGCGTETVDAADLEGKLVTQLSDDAGVNPDDVSVACPEDEEAEQGNEFDCTLTAPNGDEVIVNVTMTNDDGGFDAVVPPQQFE